VGLVIASAFATVTVAHALVPGMPWAVAVALGAIVAPPAEIAAAAIASAAGNSFKASTGVVTFTGATLGGSAIGLAVGWIISQPLDGDALSADSRTHRAARASIRCRAGLPRRRAGSTPALHVAVNASNNQLVGYGYDANGNMTGGNLSYTYDVANRVVSAKNGNNPSEQYSYGPDNLRVWKLQPDGSESLY
jgi:hypothetical protein